MGAGAPTEAQMYPQPQAPPPTMTFGYPPPPPPAPRRRTFVLLLIAAVVLAAGIAVTAVLGWSGVARMSDGVADRRAELDRMTSQEQAAAGRQDAAFRDAGLDKLFQKVKDLDQAADSALGRW